MTDITVRLTDMLEPIAAEHGLELVAVEQAGGRRAPVIRVLLDREGGIDMEAISSANRWIGELLEAEDPIAGPYVLEVSSPGIDRPLRKRADFDRFKGETVTLKSRAKQGRAAWTGVLLGMEGDDVVLEVDTEKVSIALDDIQKARIKGVVDFKERGTR